MPQADLILCASDRLARALREDDSLARQQRGESVWEAPQIHSLQQWVQQRWAASWPPEQLLHATQELALWRNAIAEDEAGAALLAPLSAAREARRANQLAIRHGIDLEHIEAQREAHAAFLRWRRRVQDRLQRERWLTPAQLPQALVHRLRDGAVAAPASVTLAGFVEPPCVHERALFEALQAAGTELRTPAPAPAAGTVEAWRPADAESQFRMIAQAIAARLAPYADHERAPPRIVVAVPDPESRRELIESSFRPILAPWLEHCLHAPRPCPWRWERGRALPEHPYLDAALAVCELRLQDNAPAAISRLLLGSALWTEEQRLLLARADARLRDRGWPQIRFQRLLDALPPPMQQRFEKLLALLGAAPARALPSDWAGHFGQRLDALGWPGQAPLDSYAFQTLREWPRLLARYSAMDAQLGRIGAGEALLWLRELARATRFEPRADHLQPILLTSLEEAASLPCDALYLADLSAEALVGASALSPYLPLELQQRAGVAGASAALGLARARTYARALAGCAPVLQLYCPSVDERGAELQASPLFEAPQGWQALAAPRNLCALDRETASGPRARLPAADPVPTVTAAELETLRASAGLFKAWFESPFFAFCRYRLGVSELPLPQRGLDPRTQGELVHAVLETVWRQLGDSAALARHDAAALAARIAGALDEQLPRRVPQADYGSVQQALERERIADVVGQWFAHERRRVDPFSVAQTEMEVHTVVGGLPLRLRVDRIDRVQAPGGERWMVLDYKTGREAEPRGWNADKLAEPQLPLYASHAVGAAGAVPHVDGICFAHLKDGHPALSAWTNWRERLIESDPGRHRSDWDELLSLWRARLEAAARAFLAGEAVLLDGVSARSNNAALLSLAGRDRDESE